MGYLERVRENGCSRYRLMAEQTRLATAVCAGQAVLDRELFGAMPSCNTKETNEPDGSQTALKDLMSAFSIGLFAPCYGPASARMRFRPSDTVYRSLLNWNSLLNQAYRAQIKPREHQRLFFEGGLWHVFIDWFEPEMRSHLEQATDLNALKRDPALKHVAEMTHPFLLRTPPAQPSSHPAAHSDVSRFANTALHIGETELGLKDPDDKAQLLANSLPEMRRPAMLTMEGVQTMTSARVLWDTSTDLYKRKYLTVDPDRLHVGLDMEAIQNSVERALPDVSTHPHRGCPALYETTLFNDRLAPFFSVMEATVIRMYCATGAISMPELRGPL